MARMRPAGSNEKPVATSPRGCETLNNGTDWARGELCAAIIALNDAIINNARPRGRDP
ncbi:hypothetical protein MCC02031_07270 [Bifidobacteriaceae bacterium MCC02031]|nr:hypothetical protein MCC02031_07270 [Bifidobacteriaceae bacterium MCC02031]